MAAGSIILGDGASRGLGSHQQPPNSNLTPLRKFKNAQK